MTETTDNLEAVRRDIIALAQGLKALNDYGSRLAGVEAICVSILAPLPEEARAQEDLASLSASAGRHKAILAILVDWDENWHFVFQFRFSTGYWTGDGFDIRKGEPGYTALLQALAIVKVDQSICDLSEPTKAGVVPTRRVIYPKPAEPKVEVKPVEPAKETPVGPTV